MIGRTSISMSDALCRFATKNVRKSASKAENPPAFVMQVKTAV